MTMVITASKKDQGGRGEQGEEICHFLTQLKKWQSGTRGDEAAEEEKRAYGEVTSTPQYFSQ